MRSRLLVLLALLVAGPAAAQPYIPGKSYYDTPQFIRYIAGNLPMVATAPHGGSLTPANIPDRECQGCSYAKDLNTLELAEAFSEAVYARCGCYPHTIINLLHRKKLDANRDLDEAADGDSTAGKAWETFHRFIGSARDSVARNFTKGLYLDLHGHGHDIQRLELGYLLTKTELQSADSLLDTQAYISESSLAGLVPVNAGGLSHAELLRGPASWGTLMHQKGYPATPSSADPFPDGVEPYFNGGYNTARYTRPATGPLFGLQIEANYTGVRDNPANIKRFADSLAAVALSWLQIHYFDQPGSWHCQKMVETESPSGETASLLEIRPNPFSGAIGIRYKGDPDRPCLLEFYRTDGRLIERRIFVSGDLYLGDQQPGIYMVVARDIGGRVVGRKTLVKQ